MLTLTPRVNYQSPIAFGWWEEAGAPGENPHKHRENMQLGFKPGTLLL